MGFSVGKSNDKMLSFSYQFKLSLSRKVQFVFKESFYEKVKNIQRKRVNKKILIKPQTLFKTGLNLKHYLLHDVFNWPVENSKVFMDQKFETLCINKHSRKIKSERMIESRKPFEGFKEIWEN